MVQFLFLFNKAKGYFAFVWKKKLADICTQWIFKTWLTETGMKKPVLARGNMDTFSLFGDQNSNDHFFFSHHINNLEERS